MGGGGRGGGGGVCVGGAASDCIVADAIRHMKLDSMFQHDTFLYHLRAADHMDFGALLSSNGSRR